MDSLSTIPRQKAAWAVVGIAIALVVAYVLWTFVGAIVVGIFLYYATRPAYRRMDDHVDHPDWTATATLLLVGLPILLLLGYAALVGIRQVDQFLVTADLEEYRSMLEPYVDVASLTDPRNLVARMRERLPTLISVGTTILVWLLRLFLLFVVAFYLLRDDHKIAAWFRRSVGEDHDAVAFLEGVDDDLSSVYVGNLATIGASGIIAILTFYALDVVAPPGTGIGFPFLLGLLLGVGTLIPAIGMKLVYFPYGAYLLWDAATGASPLWFPVVFFAVTSLVVDAFPDIIVRSYLSSGSINMGLMLLAYVLTPAAFGWYGVFLAPILLVAFLHFARRVFPNLLGGGSTGLVSG